MQTNPKITNVAIPGSAGVAVVIKCSQQCSKVRVQEDPSYNAGVAQGLTGYRLDNTVPVPTDGVTPAAVVPSPNVKQVWLPNTAGQEGPAYQPIEFGGDAGRVHGAFGNYVGGQGTPLLELTSVSATATGVIVEEWS